MNIAFLTGRSPQLAQKEIEATATILPFQWSLSILQPGIVLLKTNSSSTDEPSIESGLWSKENKNLMESLNNLQNRLGGTLKTVILHDPIENTGLVTSIISHIQADKDAKLVLGVSSYASKLDSFKLGLLLKKSLKADGYSVRVVPAKEGNALSTAQVRGNKLGSDANHLEIILIEEGSKIWIGFTVASQDIESYRKRDFSIPVPDPVSGMLSPKLAQTLINLAVNGKKVIVYDPFCGNGRIIEEARMMGLQSCGSDILQSQVEASQDNMQWIADEYGLEIEKPLIELIWQQDATKTGKAQEMNGKFVIATEPYLGRPLRQPLRPEEERGWLDELEILYLGFFQTWKDAPHKPENMIVVFPKAVCQEKGRELSLFNSLVDRVKKIGYSIEQMSEYGRADALVKREIIQLRIF